MVLVGYKVEGNRQVRLLVVPFFRCIIKNMRSVRMNRHFKLVNGIARCLAEMFKFLKLHQ